MEGRLMAATYDAIVVGGGHNGLVAAAYLARSGARHARARRPAQDRRRGDHRGAVAGRARVQGHPAVLRDEPDAADDHQRPRARAARLQGLPDGPVLPGVPRGRLDQALRRRRQAQPRGGRQVVEEGRRRHAASGTPGSPASPTCSARCCSPVPPNIGSRKPRDLAETLPAGLAAPRPRRAHDRRRHPADDDEHRRPARRLVRVAAGQGRAGGQRRDRHLGRARTSRAPRT